jgi:hypothetical protein
VSGKWPDANTDCNPHSDACTYTNSNSHADSDTHSDSNSHA